MGPFDFRQKVDPTLLFRHTGTSDQIKDRLQRCGILIPRRPVVQVQPLFRFQALVFPYQSHVNDRSRYRPISFDTGNILRPNDCVKKSALLYSVEWLWGVIWCYRI